MANTAKRNIVPAKKNIRTGNPTIIIPAAAPGKRMKGFGATSLLEIHGETLLEHQLNILRRCYPKSDIIVVVGFEANKVITKIADEYCVRFIENQDYENTGITKSISLAVNASLPNNILLIYGDLYFNQSMVKNAVKHNSKIMVDRRGMMKENEVGVVLNEKSKVENFAYDLPIKWCQITYITNKEMDILMSVINKSKYHNWLGHELLNCMINKGAYFEGYTPREGRIFEIDSKEDLQAIPKLC